MFSKILCLFLSTQNGIFFENLNWQKMLFILQKANVQLLENQETYLCEVCSGSVVSGLDVWYDEHIYSLEYATSKLTRIDRGFVIWWCHENMWNSRCKFVSNRQTWNPWSIFSNFYGKIYMYYWIFLAVSLPPFVERSSGNLN